MVHSTSSKHIICQFVSLTNAAATADDDADDDDDDDDNQSVHLKKIVFSDLLSFRCIGFGEAVAMLINYFAAKGDLGPDWKKLLHAQ